MNKADILFKFIFPIGAIIAYFAGLHTFRQYTSKAHWTYISENALLPGSGHSLWYDSDTKNMATFTREFRKISPTDDNQVEYLINKMSSFGLETYVYRDKNSSTHKDEDSVAAWGILRAPKADGKECIILSTNWNSEHSGALPGEESACDSVGMILSVAQYLTRQNWLAKDYVFVLANSSAGLGHWVDNYMYYEARAGNPQAAINLEVPRRTTTPSLTIGLHGFNGQLPNLDMLNALGKVLSYSGLSSQYINLYDKPTGVREKILNFLDSKLDVQPTLSSFMIDQAIGVPTGDHAYFNRYRIDSITIRMGDLPVVSKYSSRYKTPTQKNVVDGVIGLIRSLNNLLEHLHQSFYFYVLTNQHRYLSIAEYSVSIGLIVVPLLAAIIPTLYRLTPGISIKTVVNRRTVKVKNSGEELTEDSIKNMIKNNENNDETLKEVKKEVEEEEEEEEGEKEKEVVIKKVEKVVESGESEGQNGRAVLRSLVEIVFIHVISVCIYISSFYLFEEHLIEWLALSAFGIFLFAFIVLPFVGRAISSEVDADSWRAFSLLPLTLFLTTVSLMNFSFCAIAAIVTVPVSIIFSFPLAKKKPAVLTMQIGLMLLVTLPSLVCVAAKGLEFETPIDFVRIVFEQHIMGSSLLFPFAILIYLSLNISQLKLLIYSF